MSDVSIKMDILNHARNNGFHGFGGFCGVAAVSINRVLFHGEGKLLGIFNEAFFNKGRCIGHVCVLDGRDMWDGDGYPKSMEDMIGWGSLDPNDVDYISLAKDLGVVWDDDSAQESVVIEFEDERELSEFFKMDALQDMVEILNSSKSELDNSWARSLF